MLIEQIRQFLVVTFKKSVYRLGNDSRVVVLVYHFSSAWLCQQSHCCGAGVRRPSVRRALPSSVKRVFSETAKGVNAKSCGKVATHRISRPFFFIIHNFVFFSNFAIFSPFINTWPYVSENFKTLLVPYFSFVLNLFFSKHSLWHKYSAFWNFKFKSFFKKDWHFR